MGIVNPELFNVFSGGMIRKMTLTVARGTDGPVWQNASPKLGTKTGW